MDLKSLLQKSPAFSSAKASVMETLFKKNSFCTIPEIVLAGNKITGKATLLERLLNFPLPSKLPMLLVVKLRRSFAEKMTVGLVDKKTDARCGELIYVDSEQSALRAYQDVLAFAGSYVTQQVAPMLLSDLSLVITIYSQEADFPVLDVLSFPGLVSYSPLADQKRAWPMLQEHIDSPKNASSAFYLIAVDTKLRSCQIRSTVKVRFLFFYLILNLLD